MRKNYIIVGIVLIALSLGVFAYSRNDEVEIASESIAVASPTPTITPEPTLTPTPEVVTEYIYVQPTTTPKPTMSQEEYERIRDAMISDSQQSAYEEYKEWDNQRKIDEMYRNYKYGF